MSVYRTAEFSLDLTYDWAQFCNLSVQDNSFNSAIDPGEAQLLRQALLQRAEHFETIPGIGVITASALASMFAVHRKGTRIRLS